MNEKTTVRRALRDRRERLTEREWMERSERVENRLMHLPAFRRAKAVGLYAAVRREVDTARLLAACLAAGKVVAYPRVLGRGRLRFHCVAGAPDLRPGFRGIPEPREGTPALAPGALDLLVVPGVGFDRSGHRLGYGGGYYDRFLGAHPPPAARVGLAFDFQIVRRLPREATDAELDLVVGESTVVRGRRRSRRSS